VIAAGTFRPLGDHRIPRKNGTVEILAKRGFYGSGGLRITGEFLWEFVQLFMLLHRLSPRQHGWIVAELLTYGLGTAA
jgi:hypothetical protein